MDENRQQHLLEGAVLRFATETLVDKAMELDHISRTFADLVYPDSLFSDNPYLSRVHLLQETEVRLDSTALGSKTKAKVASPACTSSNTTAPGNLGRDMYVLVSYLMGILEVYLPIIGYVVLSSQFNTFQNLKFFLLDTPACDNVDSLAISLTSNEGAVVLA